MPERKGPNFFSYHNEQIKLPIDSYDSPEYMACRAFYDRITHSAASDIPTYTDLFNDVGEEKAIGEASTTSLYHPPAAGNIKRFTPNAKMIAILRNPTDRAFSAYTDGLRRGHEDRTFREAIEQEPIDSDYIWWGPGKLYYVRPGFYSKQLQRYYEHFDRKQIKIYLFDEFTRNPSGVVKDIFNFLEVDDSFQPDMSRKENISGVPVNGNFDSFFNLAHSIYDKYGPIKDIKNLVWKGLPKRFRDNVSTAKRNASLVKHFEKEGNNNDANWKTYYDGQFVKPTMSSDMKVQLIDIFREDIRVLEGMLDKDLSTWL